MKRVVLFKGNRYRLISRKKQQAQKGQVYIDNSDNFKMCKRKTTNKYYCYELAGKGRYYVFQKQRVQANPEDSPYSHRYLIRDCKAGKIATTVYDKNLIDQVLEALNNSTNGTQNNP